MTVIFRIVFTLILFFSASTSTTVHAEQENSDEILNQGNEKTEQIIGDNEVKQEDNSDYVVPTSEDLEGVTQMEVVNNVDEKGNVFDHENLVGSKQFLTVVTPDGRTYYIIINYEQFGTKVHLLKDMSEVDVESVASAQPQAGAMTTVQAEMHMQQNAENTGQSSEETNPIVRNLLIFGAVVIVVGIIAFFKMKKDGSSSSDGNF